MTDPALLSADRLLSQRRKTGGYAALLCLGGSLLSAAFGRGTGVMTGAALVGLVLLASVWRRLD